MKALFLVSLAAGLWGTVGVASRLMTRAATRSIRPWPG